MSVGDGTEWALEGEALSGAALEGDRVFGTGGVNRYAGEYTLDGDRLSLGPLASTRMAGSPEADQAELEFFAALERAARLTFVDSRLVLADADGTELLCFTRTQPTDPEEAP